MKLYETPEMEIIRFEYIEVITTSLTTKWDEDLDVGEENDGF